MRWERLCANLDEGWYLLAIEQRTPFSLYIPAITNRRFPPIGRRDLRSLVLVASPSDRLAQLCQVGFYFTSASAFLEYASSQLAQHQLIALHQS